MYDLHSFCNFWFNLDFRIFDVKFLVHNPKMSMILVYNPGFYMMLVSVYIPS